MIYLVAKNGPGKNGLGGVILNEKVVVRPDYSWLTKNGPVELILITKSIPAWPKMVWCHELSTNVSTNVYCSSVFKFFMCLL